MAEVQIGAGLFPAKAVIGLYQGRQVVEQTEGAEDSTAVFEGLSRGGVYTVRRVDGHGATVYARAKDGGGRNAGVPRPEQVHAQQQAEALASGNQNAPKFTDPRTGQVSRKP